MPKMNPSWTSMRHLRRGTEHISFPRSGADRNRQDWITDGKSCVLFLVWSWRKLRASTLKVGLEKLDVLSIACGRSLVRRDFLQAEQVCRRRDVQHAATDLGLDGVGGEFGGRDGEIEEQVD